MRVSVVVPYRPDDGLRDAHWAKLCERWRTAFPHWDVVTGTTHRSEGPWIKAVAAERAVRAADALEPDVLVVADADVWLTPSSALAQAASLVHTGQAAWAVPHNQVRRLGLASSEHVLNGGRFGEHLALAERVYKGMVGGGIAVFSRQGWERIGGFDPRFKGWGGEDSALGRAADTLLGRHTRLDGTLWHFWHEPQQRISRTKGSQYSDNLLSTYRRCTGRPALMNSLIKKRPPTPR